MTLSSLFERNNKFVFSINKLGIHGNQLILAEVVNINHYKSYNFFLQLKYKKLLKTCIV